MTTMRKTSLAEQCGLACQSLRWWAIRRWKIGQSQCRFGLHSLGIVLAITMRSMFWIARHRARGWQRLIERCIRRGTILRLTMLKMRLRMTRLSTNSRTFWSYLMLDLGREILSRCQTIVSGLRTRRGLKRVAERLNLSHLSIFIIQNPT